MGRWVAIYEGATGPKLRRFSKMAGCSEAEALGILGYIWLWAVNDNADSDGRLMDTDRESLSKVFATAIASSGMETLACI